MFEGIRNIFLRQKHVKSQVISTEKNISHCQKKREKNKIWFKAFNFFFFSTLIWLEGEVIHRISSIWKFTYVTIINQVRL